MNGIIQVSLINYNVVKVIVLGNAPREGARNVCNNFFSHNWEMSPKIGNVVTQKFVKILTKRNK